MATTYDRDTYVRDMEAAGLTPETDDDLTSLYAYALQFGRYDFRDTSKRTWQRLGRQRREAILAGLPQSQPRPSPRMERLDCGHTVSAGLRMAASTGSSCPDCYDQMSE